jgi:hypothetical protein
LGERGGLLVVLTIGAETIETSCCLDLLKLKAKKLIRHELPKIIIDPKKTKMVFYTFVA